MEKEKWIENILNSTKGITPVAPPDDLFSKIQQRIAIPETVSTKTIWMVAASIAALLLLNLSVLNTRPASKPTTAGTDLEMTVNQSNQLYQ